MFSLIQKSLAKVRSFANLFERLDTLEKRLDALEAVSAEQHIAKLFIEEVERQEEAAFQTLQEELNDTMLRSIKPMGEA